MRTTPDTKAPLDRLPALNRSNVDDHCAERNTPLPCNRTMLEHLLIDDRDVHNREHDEEASENSEEEKAVAPESWEDRQTAWSALIGVRVHVEE